MALTQLLTPEQPVAEPALVAAIRRCTYRRLGRLSSGPEGGYEVSCLYPDRKVALPIGDPTTSLSVCANCTASHIFRPDED